MEASQSQQYHASLHSQQAPQEPSALLALCSKLDRLDENLKLHLGRLTDAADRAHGQMPEGTGKQQGPSPVPNGVLAQIEEKMTDIEGRLTLADRQVDRITRVF